MLSSYNRFAKTSDSQSEDEGEGRLQSSAVHELRSGCKLKMKENHGLLVRGSL